MAVWMLMLVLVLMLMLVLGLGLLLLPHLLGSLPLDVLCKRLAATAKSNRPDVRRRRARLPMNCGTVMPILSASMASCRCICWICSGLGLGIGPFGGKGGGACIAPASSIERCAGRGVRGWVLCSATRRVEQGNCGSCRLSHRIRSVGPAASRSCEVWSRGLGKTICCARLPASKSNRYTYRQGPCAFWPVLLGAGGWMPRPTSPHPFLT